MFASIIQRERNTLAKRKAKHKVTVEDSNSDSENSLNQMEHPIAKKKAAKKSALKKSKYAKSPDGNTSEEEKAYQLKVAFLKDRGATDTEIQDSSSDREE